MGYKLQDFKWQSNCNKNLIELVYDNRHSIIQIGAEGGISFNIPIKLWKSKIVEHLLRSASHIHRAPYNYLYYDNDNDYYVNKCKERLAKALTESSNECVMPRYFLRNKKKLTIITQAYVNQEIGGTKEVKLKTNLAYYQGKSVSRDFLMKLLEKAGKQ